MKLKPGTPLIAWLQFGPRRRVRVGRLALDRGVAVLEYSADFLASRLVLNPRFGEPGRALVRAENPRAFQGLHGVFADSLPDAWGEELMRRRSAAAGIAYATLTGVDKLSWVGHRGAGALVYEPETAPSESEDAIDLDVLAREAYAVLAGRDSEIVPKLERLGGSAGGARPKVLVAMNADGDLIAGSDEVPDGFDAWIVKFRGPLDVVDVGPLEAAYAEMARASAIDMPQTKLIRARTRKRGYFATKRFDRSPGGIRRHAVSVAGLLDSDWRTPSMDYRDLLSVVRMVTRSQPAVEEMFRRMVFNVIAYNRDDHTKQHALLMDDAGRWSLAPAYDLTFSGGPGGEHYLTVDGEGTNISLKAMEAVAGAHGIGSPAVRETVARTVDAVRTFTSLANAFGVTKRTAAEVTTVLREQIARYSTRISG
ncbi:MAG TPA: type II toxin-antitoxin system HipA family toxin [Candidatus Elarobacter sp.]|jgi:serine/threonine-protein kinase HipA